MMTAAKWTYETEPCGRCGGSGHYSYCQMHGTVCFDCRGKKVRLTKRARRIANAVTAIRTRTRLAGTELEVGMEAGLVTTAGLTGPELAPKAYRTVDAITVTGDWCAKSGDKTWYYRVIRWSDGTEERVGSELYRRRLTSAEQAEIDAILTAGEGKGVTRG
jgi:hypothetical protein